MDRHSLAPHSMTPHSMAVEQEAATPSSSYAQPHVDKEMFVEDSVCAASFSSWATPDVALGAALPKGCAVGIPVVAGIAARALPEGKGLLSVAMGFVQRDDYHGLMELARRGRADALSERRRCSFSLSLKPEGHAQDLPSSLKVAGANLLHYAVCIGSFRAAAALIVVNPALLRGTCVVVTAQAGEVDSPADVRGEVWGVVELARLFCVLYEGNTTDPEVVATSDMYEKALCILEVTEQDPLSLPFTSLTTVEERIAAAGCDADRVIAVLFAVTDGAMWVD